MKTERPGGLVAGHAWGPCGKAPPMACMAVAQANSRTFA